MAGGSKASMGVELGDKLHKNFESSIIRGFNLSRQGDLASQSMEDSRFRNRLAQQQFDLGKTVTDLQLLDRERANEGRRKFMLAMARG